MVNIEEVLEDVKVILVFDNIYDNVMLKYEFIDIPNTDTTLIRQHDIITGQKTGMTKSVLRMQMNHFLNKKKWCYKKEAGILRIYEV